MRDVARDWRANGGVSQIKLGQRQRGKCAMIIGRRDVRCTASLLQILAGDGFLNLRASPGGILAHQHLMAF